MKRYIIRMRRYATVLLTLTLFCTLFLNADTYTLHPVEAISAVQVNKGSPFGVEAALGNRVREDEIGRAVELLRESGVQWQREEIFWDRVQTERGGPFDWDGDGSGFFNYDYAIEAQVHAGINVVGLLDYNPAWFKGQHPPIDEWIDDWGNFVYQTVARYGRDRGWITHWELWNEPNVAEFGFYGGLNDPYDFVRILEVGSAAARAADPNAVVVMGGISGIMERPEPYNYHWVDYLYQIGEMGAWKHVDVLAIHFYQPEAPENPVQRFDRLSDFRNELDQLDAIMDRYGHRPVWITEMGWSTNNVWPGVDADSQAFYLIRSYMLAIAHPSVEKVFWYDFRDDTWPDAPYDDPAYNSREVNFHFGLIRRHYPLDPNRQDLRKPSFLAYRTMSDMLGGLTLKEVVDDGHDGIFWYRFGSDQRNVDVLWRTGEASPDLSVDCGCKEALVRLWNGELKYVLYAEQGTLKLRLDGVGSPMFVEYAPPVREKGEYFAQTGHTLRGSFRTFWHANGGLARFGYPLTEEIVEPEPGSGRPRVVQYFERVRLEYFPEYSGTGQDVQIARLGNLSLMQQGVDWQMLPKVEEAPEGCVLFAETGHTICPPFLDVWEQGGGVALVGYPLTEAFAATRPDTGEPYTVQYFERARLEYTPTHQGTAADVLSGLLARELFTRHGGM